MIGLLFGLLFGIFFDDADFLGVVLYGLSPASSSGRPSARSPKRPRGAGAISPRSSTMQAERYELQVDHEVSAQAKQLLAGMPAA